MKPNRNRKIATGIALLASPLLVFAALQFSNAADHLDPPTRTDPALDATPDLAADIADVYTWHTPTSVVIAMTFAGPRATVAPGTYDRNALYTINISNDGAAGTTEFPIRIRFGADASAGPGQFGVQIMGLPGVTGALSGPVETILTRDGVTATAGLFDDPFFFDLQGFRDTRNTGTLSFNNQRNFFAGQNLTAIVVEIPRSRLANGTNRLDIWGETARLGGNL